MIEPPRQPPLAGSTTSPTLLLRVRDWNDGEAWATFCDIYRPLVVGWCLHRCSLSRSAADDVAQDVMTAVAGAIRSFDYDPAAGRFRGWLLTATRRAAAKHVDREAKQPVARSDSLGAIAVTSGDESAWDARYAKRLFEWACERVRPTVKEQTWHLFKRSFIEDKPAAEVASECGVEPGQVYVARSRVLSRLREAVLEATGELLHL